jgi:hypothetical protein
MKRKLKPPGTKHLKAKYDKLLSNAAFKFNVRRYKMERGYGAAAAREHEQSADRGLHSSTFQLNLSTFSSMWWGALLVSVTKRLRLSKDVDECKTLPADRVSVLPDTLHGEPHVGGKG